MRHEQRLHAQPVTGEEQRTLLAVVDCEGEHPVEAAEAFDPPALPRGEDHLAVAVGAELRAQPCQLAPQLAKIVDFAVEHQRRAPVGGRHRLGRAREIDDRQAAEAEADPRRGPHAAVVRPAVDQSIAHPFDPRGIDRLGRGAMEYPRDPAHRRAR